MQLLFTHPWVCGCRAVLTASALLLLAHTPLLCSVRSSIAFFLLLVLHLPLNLGLLLSRACRCSCRCGNGRDGRRCQHRVYKAHLRHDGQSRTNRCDTLQRRKNKNNNVRGRIWHSFSHYFLLINLVSDLLLSPGPGLPALPEGVLSAGWGAEQETSMNPAQTPLQQPPKQHVTHTRRTHKTRELLKSVMKSD